MKASLAVFASAGILGLAFAHSHTEPVGVLSYIDIEGGGVRAAECVAHEPDVRACTPNVEVIYVEAYRDCVTQGLTDCQQKVAFPVPFFEERIAEEAEKAMEEAWENFYLRTIDESNREINSLPPCWVPGPCPQVNVDWACVGQRLLAAATTALTEFLLDYWVDVHMAVATHLPTALWWQDVLPEMGAIIAPIFSLVPKPEQYAGMVETARDAPYYFQPPAFPRLPVPYTAGDLEAGQPGIPELEARKRSLEQATLLEYQQFGFTTFFQAYGGYQNTLFFRWDRGPYLVGACLIQVPPFILPVPVPVPNFIPLVPKAFTAYESVPEGYEIPRVKGQPLW